ncbi:MAG: class II aldolase/adducin family protein [Pseudomonadota bacterium]
MPEPDADRALRQAIIDQCLFLDATGLNQGTSGNISVRRGEEMLITPSSTPYAAMTPEMICAMPLSAGPEAARGPRPPSSEWRMHRDILAARPEFGAVVHAHPPYCTTLAIARRPIPAVHYMIALFGGPEIRCAGYATFGTQALSDHALAALEDRSACLLANHGMLACGPTLEKAMALAVELETLARQHYQALLIGGGHVLTDAQVAETAEAMARLSYGR